MYDTHRQRIPMDAGILIKLETGLLLMLGPATEYGPQETTMATIRAASSDAGLEEQLSYKASLGSGSSYFEDSGFVMVGESGESEFGELINRRKYNNEEGICLASFITSHR